MERLVSILETMRRATCICLGAASILVISMFLKNALASTPVELRTEIAPIQHIADESHDGGTDSDAGDNVPTTVLREVGACPSSSESNDRIFVLPENPTSDRPTRLIALNPEIDQRLELTLLNHLGETVVPDHSDIWGQRPQGISLIFSGLEPGQYRACLSSLSKEPSSSLSFNVHETPVKPAVDSPSQQEAGVWPIHREWSPRTEELFSVFVAKLFYIRPGSRKGWKPLHQATRDPYRNILYGILGFDEDNEESDTHVTLEPDCADAPYHVRAYFAWKMGLSFLFNKCNRGSADRGPTCSPWRSNLTAKLTHHRHPVTRFNAFVKQYIGWHVHAGNPRTLPETETSDFYPLALDGIRPGSVFVDAGGHVILVTQVEPQTQDAMGAIYGVDAHPDRTVSHKRFSSGTFVFNPNVPTDGFKGFRPVVVDNGEPHFLSNQEINARGGYPSFSDEQADPKRGREFYRTVAKLLNPRPVDPRDVLEAKLEVLHSAMVERVTAVQLGVDYMNDTGWSVMPMPRGPAIFQTTGPWESYSTPARDMRCFLAIDDVMHFPKRVLKNRSLYAIPDETVEDVLLDELEMLRDRALRNRRIRYTRSDGSEWSLTLEDIVDRQKQLEMAYNPNDCPEIRWAAPRSSTEFETCKVRAPSEQQRRMRLSRHWFASRRRPDQR